MGYPKGYPWDTHERYDGLPMGYDPMIFVVVAHGSLMGGRVVTGLPMGSPWVVPE